MANKKLTLNINDLDKEYKLMESELAEIDKLFDEAKTRLDNSSSMTTRSNPVFIVQQTGNLISLKEKKLNIIKEMSSIKRTKMDMLVKEFNINNKEDSTNDANNELLEQMFTKLMNMDRKELVDNTKIEREVIVDNSPTEDEMDKIIEERLSSKQEQEEEYEEFVPSNKNDNNYRVVVDKESNLYVVDEDYNLIEKHNLNLDDIVIDEFTQNEDGEDIAIDINGNIYEVVELED